MYYMSSPKHQKTYISKLIEIKHCLDIWNADSLKRSLDFCPQSDRPQGYELPTKTEDYFPLSCVNDSDTINVLLIVNNNILFTEYYYNLLL